MFENLNFWEVGVLLLLALFIFGPERLPKVINDGVRMLRNLRDMARNATDDLSRELGTEVRLEDLHPRTFIRKHLLSEEEERQLRRPFDDAYRDLRQLTADVNDVTSPPRPLAPRSQGPLTPYDSRSHGDPPSEANPQDGGVQPHQDHPYGDHPYGDRPYGDRPYGGGAARTHGETVPPRDPGAHSYDADAT